MDNHATGKLMLSTALNHRVISTSNIRTADSVKRNTQKNNTGKDRNDSV